MAATGPGGRLVEVQEGATRFRAPPTTHAKGPKAKEGVPFYNPAMRLARDLSVLVLRRVRELAGRDLTVCDAMSSLGARGLRFAREVEGVQVLLNDANSDSVALAMDNARALGLGNVDFRIGRLEPLLANDRWDWVDIDPFGTPAPYLDLAADAVREGGVLAVTATDKAALCGVYAKVCLRRYNAQPLRGPIMGEVAARILLAAVARAAGRRDRSIEPLLIHSTDHYVRAYVRVRDGAAAADRQATSYAYAWMAADLSRGLAPAPPAATRWAGPLWGENLGDPAFVGALRSEDRALGRLLPMLVEDASGPPLYYTIDEFTRVTKTQAPRLDALVGALQERGHRAARTHFTPRGIRTDAPADLLRLVLRGR